MPVTTVAALLIFVAICVLFASSWIGWIKSRRDLRRRLEESWGKMPEARYKAEEFQSIASYFHNRRRERPSLFTIDDITWHDLDMDQVFGRLNRTESTVGEECLYCMLREPSFEPDTLGIRRDLIAFFREHPAEKVALQVILARLGKNCLLTVTDCFFHPQARPPWKGFSTITINAY
ncbi:MAG: hypothetical protein ABSH28_23540 [Acidobacteriota bacterium]|jgi:hypothetical protein